VPKGLGLGSARWGLERLFTTALSKGIRGLLQQIKCCVVIGEGFAVGAKLVGTAQVN
jgi:hypothetical protein